MKLPEKVKIYGKFAWKNRLFNPDPRPPKFQTRFTPLGLEKEDIEKGRSSFYVDPKCDYFEA